MKISVILCTHDPRPDHLERTLSALRAQTLPAEAWELLVVDNASSVPIEPSQVSSLTARVRILREPVLGLVAARLLGIEKAGGDLLVFVDDDNVLAADYLEQADRLLSEKPSLGSFGGRIQGEFEKEPSPWFASRVDRLAIRGFSAPAFSRQPDFALAPCGAGLCIRADVARFYRERALNDPRRHALGRSGRKLFSGDDLDLAFTACDMGLETGIYPQLRLTHLIPKERLTLRYFAKITRSHARGHLQLVRLRNHPKADRRLWHSRWALLKWTVIDSVLSMAPGRPRTAPPRR